jgi:hypothetical protein
MASGVFKRVVYFDKLANNGPVVLHDWCQVTTAVGTMWEPARPWQRLSPTLTGQAATYDPTDDISRVDDLCTLPMGKEIQGDSPLIGGATYPRKGY